VENTTATLGSGLPAESSTSADSATVPPFCGTVAGATANATEPTAALPTRTVTPPELLLPEPVLALPEYALIVAVPERLGAMYVATARPFTVCASVGSTRPSVG
jgi:hypothetical protein